MPDQEVAQQQIFFETVALTLFCQRYVSCLEHWM